MNCLMRCLCLQPVVLLCLFWPGMEVKAEMKTYHAGCALGSLLDYQDKQALFDQCAEDYMDRHPDWGLSLPYSVTFDTCTNTMSPELLDKACSFKLRLQGSIGDPLFSATQCYYPGPINGWNGTCPSSCPPDRPLDPETGECGAKPDKLKNPGHLSARSV